MGQGKRTRHFRPAGSQSSRGSGPGPRLPSAPGTTCPSPRRAAVTQPRPLLLLSARPLRALRVLPRAPWLSLECGRSRGAASPAPPERPSRPRCAAVAAPPPPARWGAGRRRRRSPSRGAWCKQAAPARPERAAPRRARTELTEDGNLRGGEKLQEEDREEACCSRRSEIAGGLHGCHE